VSDSLWWQEPEAEVLPTLEQLGIGFVPFSPPAGACRSASHDDRDPDLVSRLGSVRIHG
jgi:aryl-alcohol dehydrogenase-like predicted oxidoreductase